jgi:hypothetical protein
MRQHCLIRTTKRKLIHIFVSEIVERQIEEIVATRSKEELAHRDSQRETEEKNSDAMLSKWNEEIELLEEMLRRQDSGREESTTRREKACSKEVKVNSNFQIKLENAGIAERNEHEVEVASRLFPEDEIKPQIQHTKLMDFEEEMKFLENGWLQVISTARVCRHN